MKVQNSWINKEKTGVFTRRGRGTMVCLHLLALLVVFVCGASAETFRKTKMIDPKGREQAVDLGFDSGKQVNNCSR